MSEKEEKNPLEEMQKQMREMFKNSDISSIFNQMGAASPGGEPPTEKNGDDDRETARVRLLELFATLGNADPRVLKARRALSSALF